jgi:hypothetical protein
VITAFQVPIASRLGLESAAVAGLRAVRESTLPLAVNGNRSYQPRRDLNVARDIRCSSLLQRIARYDDGAPGMSGFDIARLSDKILAQHWDPAPSFYRARLITKGLV